MKMRKVISAVLAGVLALSALPISAMSASAAEGAYALGDVDMDGVITGHDAAMVSRYLHVDSNLLNADQLALADVNGDGVVDQADADWIHENEEKSLGAVWENRASTTTLFYQLYYLAHLGVGNHFTVSNDAGSLDEAFETFQMPALEYHLMDFDGDGKVTLDDLTITSCYIGYKYTGRDVDFDGRYDYEMDMFVDIDPIDCSVIDK